MLIEPLNNSFPPCFGRSPSLIGCSASNRSPGVGGDNTPRGCSKALQPNLPLHSLCVTRIPLLKSGLKSYVSFSEGQLRVLGDHSNLPHFLRCAWFIGNHFILTHLLAPFEFPLTIEVPSGEEAIGPTRNPHQQLSRLPFGRSGEHTSRHIFVTVVIHPRFCPALHPPMSAAGQESMVRCLVRCLCLWLWHLRAFAFSFGHTIPATATGSRFTRGEGQRRHHIETWPRADKGVHSLRT